MCLVVGIVVFSGCIIMDFDEIVVRDGVVLLFGGCMSGMGEAVAGGRRKRSSSERNSEVSRGGTGVVGKRIRGLRGLRGGGRRWDWGKKGGNREGRGRIGRAHV